MTLNDLEWPFCAVAQPGFSFGWVTTQLSFHSFPFRPLQAPHPPFLPFTLSALPFPIPLSLPCYLCPAAMGLGSAVIFRENSRNIVNDTYYFPWKFFTNMLTKVWAPQRIRVIRARPLNMCMVHFALTSQPLVTFVLEFLLQWDTSKSIALGRF